MPWFPKFGSIGDIEKKICRYLLQRYLGNYFEDKINLEQLEVDLKNGKGTIQNISLNCESLNELCESQGWGIEVTEGHIGEVKINIPWTNAMSEDSSVEITELSLTLRPLPRQSDGGSMLESMWSSMSSSMQLAKDCLEQQTYEDEIELNTSNTPIDGLEKFAQTIDNMLNRIKAKLCKSTIRIEFILPNNNHGIAIIIKIDELEYQNEARDNPQQERPPTPQNDLCDDETDEKTHLVATYATHYFKINGISFYTEEFRIFNDNDKKSNINLASSLISDSQFYSVISNLPDSESFSDDKQSNNETNLDLSSETDNENKYDDEIEGEILSSECIRIVELFGTQEIRINTKQAESGSGPKVLLDMQLGTLNVFITPRQLHLVWKFFDIFFNDSLEYYATKQNNRELNEEKNLDSQLNQQQKNFSSNMSGIIGNLGGWCTDPTFIDDVSITNLKQFSSKDNNSNCGTSSASRKKSTFEYCESVTSSYSNSSSSATTCSSKFQQRKTAINSNDLNGDISHFSVRIASGQLILLHEDVLLESTLSDSPPVSDESATILLKLSNEYFECLSTANEKSYLCNKNNLKMNFSPIIIEGEQQRNSNCILLKLTLSATRFDLYEILDNISTSLIDFNRKDSSNSQGFQRRPELTMSIKSTSYTNSRNKHKKKLIPRTDIHFNVENSTIDFDITLYDRIHAVFSNSPYSMELPDTEKNVPKKRGTVNRAADKVIDLKVDSPNLNVRLRFPIIDSRPFHDPERVPYSKQNIRPDFLLFNFCQFRLSNIRNLIEITANEINIYYYENLNSSKIHIAKTTLIDNSGISSKESYIEYPKISIEFPTDKYLETVIRYCMGDSDSGETSGESCPYIKRSRVPVPFSTKRVCRQSDTPHAKEDSDDSETILLPGESAEMKRFCERAMKTSKLQIKVFLPVASVQIKSKMLYEIIYNRINSDLLMWEPISPNKPPAHQEPKFNSKRSSPKNTEDNFWNSPMMDSVYIPSTINETNEGNCGTGTSDDNETDADSDSVYYTAYDRKRSAKKNSQSTVSALAISDCSFELDVTRAIATLFTPVRDNDNRVIPEQFGEFVFNVQGLTLFTVNGFNGDPNLAYLCIQSKTASLYHSGLVSNTDIAKILRLINSTLPNYLLSTLYPTPDDLTIDPSKKVENAESLSFAIEINKVPETRVKRLRLTALIQSSTLNHNPESSPHTWINQLIDFFDVTDYPIEGGYVPYMPVTEMQLHLWNCAIDYRPKNLQYRAVLEVGNFMLSSTIISAISGCTIRIIAEDCILSLAPQDIDSSKSTNKTKGSSKQLVPVVDIGLVDISLKLNNKDSEANPKLDLRASIQDMHIRTCSDSGNALAILIAYFASDGDLNSTEDEAESNMSSVINDDSSIDLLSVSETKKSNSEITAEQQERVNLMMAEALRDTVSGKKLTSFEEEYENLDKGVELFFFPDENQTKMLVDQNVKKDSTRIERVTQDEARSVSRSSSEEWRFSKSRRESESSNELRDLLNFETSIMNLPRNDDNESVAVEALPQIREELGQIACSCNKKNENHSRKSSVSTDDGFCVIGEEEKATTVGITDVKVSQDPLRIVDNHFTTINGKSDLLTAPEGFPTAVTRYTLCEMTVTWHIYGGNDFPLKDEKQKSGKDKENQFSTFNRNMTGAYKMGVSYSKSQQTVQFGKKPITKLSWKTRGGSGRNHDVAVDIQLTKARFSHEIYPSNTTQASRQVIVISELEIRDRLQSSEINKFLYHPKAKHLPNKSSKHMIVIKSLNIRPNLNLPTQECSLRISLLPLRLNIDQDTLLFMVKFFNEIANSDSEGEASNKKLQLQEPVMMVDDLPEAIHDLEARKMVSTNLELLMEDEFSEFKDKQKKHSSNAAIDVAQDIDNSPIFFKEVIFSPEVLIRLDYHGRRIELSHGPIAGLLMGLGQLQCSEIRLKKIVHKRGILGFDKLLHFLFKEWLQDIKKNQLPAILSGVGPMYTFVQLFQGIRDLIWLPIEQYQKDGRIVRGLQLGAQSFTARTALAVLEITSRLIQVLQITAETAFDIVSPGPSQFRRGQNRKGKRKRVHHPQDIREGVATAYQIVRDGLNETAHALIENTVAEHDQKGYSGAVGAVFRQVPPMVVCPVVLATQATTNVLSGVKNQLVPDAKFEHQMKWKDGTD